MGLASKAGDWALKAFTASLGVATVYLAATFSVNVYRGLSWHNAHSKIDNSGEEQRANETSEVTLSFVMNVGAILLFGILFRYSQVAEK